MRNVTKYGPRYGRVSERSSFVDKVSLVKRKSKVSPDEIVAK